MRAYNFSAGPSRIPLPVLQRLQREISEYAEGKYWIGEISHRSTEFVEFTQSCRQKIRQVLEVPKNYEVIFLHGGISLQYPLFAMNFLQGIQKGAYFITGHWSQRAFNLAYHPQVFTLSGMNDFTTIPEVEIPKDLGYLYVCDNETIHGVEFDELPDCENIILDTTSNIFTKKINFSKIGALVFSTQKNLGVSGLAVMIVREDFLEFSRQKTNLSPIFRFAEIFRQDSMVNTPNTLAIYIAGLVLDWIIEQGGVEYFANFRKKKSDLLYQTIDQSDTYQNYVEKKFRSKTNIPFSLKNEAQTTKFLQEAQQKDLLFLKGHRAMGGVRASIYNAMEFSGVEKLVDFMNNFK